MKQIRHGALKQVDGRYSLLEKLGSGGRSTVYKALDLGTNRTVALKLLDKAADNDLEMEFAHLSRLRHPNLVRILDMGRADGRSFLAMELAPGKTIDRVISGPDHISFFPALAGVCKALQYIHSRGLVHNDIKPSNIMVDATRPEKPAVKLLDFSLAAPAGSDELIQRGTLHYMAPEVIRGGPVDKRADLYSLGVLLFELLTGNPPFDKNNPIEVLRATLFEEIPDLRLLCPDMPLGLEEVVYGLMSKEPAARFSSVDEVLTALNEVSGRDDKVAGTAIEQTYTLLPGFVGRSKELADLEEAALMALDKVPRIAMVTGETGVGKSRLLDELGVTIEVSGLKVFKGLFHENDDRPLAAFHDILDGLVSSYRDVASVLVEKYQQSMSFISGDPAISEAGIFERDQVYKFYDDISCLLDELARIRPFALLLDDAHMASGDSMHLLRYLAFKKNRGPYFLAISMNSKNDNAYALSLAADLQSEPDTLLKKINRFDHNETIRLLEKTFGEIVEAQLLADRLQRDSDGLASTAVTMLRGLEKSGALIRSAGAWHVRMEMLPPPDEPLPSWPVEPGLPAEILDNLSRDQLRVVRALAAMGYPCTLNELTAYFRELKAKGNGFLLPSLAGLEGRGLVQRIGPRWRLRTSTARTAILAGIPIKRRKKMLRASARTLEKSRCPQKVIATRWAEAGNFGPAVEHGILAANSARATGTGWDALDILTRVIDWLDRGHDTIPDSELKKRNVSKTAGTIAVDLGRLDQAEALLLPLAEENEDPWIYKILVDGYKEAGRYSDSLKWCREGLESPSLDAKLKALLHYSAGWCLMMLGRYKDAEKEAGLAENSAAGIPEVLARIHILRGNLGWYTSKYKEAKKNFEKAGRMFAGLGDRKGKADSITGLATLARFRGELKVAAGLYQEALTEYRSMGSLSAVSKGLNNLGIAKYLLGKWKEAADLWEMHARTCRQMGEQSELVNALNNLGYLYTQRGDLVRAERSLNLGLELAERTGFSRMRATLLGNLGDIMAQKGNKEKARRLYQQAEEEARRIGAEDELVELKRRFGELHLISGRLTRARSILKEAYTEAKRLGLAHEEARIDVLIAGLERRFGDPETGLSRLKRAEALIEDLGEEYEAARMRLEKARCLTDLGMAREAREEMSKSRSVLEPLGARTDLEELKALEHRLTLGGVDLARKLEHHRILIEVAKGIAPILDLDDLLVKVVDKTIEVVSADKGFLILLDNDTRPVFRVGRNSAGRSLGPEDFAVSRGVVDQVLRTGEPVTVADMDKADNFRYRRSVVTLGLRSVACVPLIGRSTDPIGLVYVDSKDPAATLVGPDLPLLEALAGHAAVAIENARLYEEQVKRREQVATIAHELKTPLTAISGFTDLLLMEPSGPDQRKREYLKLISTEVQRMARLVHDVLDLSLLESKAMRYKKEKIDIKSLLKEVALTMKPLADVEGVDLEFNMGPGASKVLGDRDRLSQVVTNLVANAIRYSGNGQSVQIACLAVKDDDKNGHPGKAQKGYSGMMETPKSNNREPGWVEIRVRDTGPGVDDSEKKIIFERFYKGKGGEHGLGLAITRTLVQEHKGSIWVEDAPGGGAVFVVRLPAVSTP
ncbi:MAG: protein kinase [Deltaproteobacteria bacterium]|nr:protein kinase [Deltaproteobacteria bacterium]